MVNSLCNCEKTVNQLMLEDISAEIEIKYRPSKENDKIINNNDVSMSHIHFLYEEAKGNYLIDEISRKDEIKSMYDNNHGETIKGIEKEISFLKGELANINQLLSNLCNKNSTYFLQGDAFPRKPTEEPNENIGFAIDTPAQYPTIPLNSTNCDEGDDIP